MNPTETSWPRVGHECCGSVQPKRRNLFTHAINRYVLTIPLGILLTFPVQASNFPISDAAYPVLLDRTQTNRHAFYVYQDGDSGFNHGFPSGLFGTLSKIHIDTACIDDPASTNGCSTNLNNLDSQHGNVFRISFDSFSAGEYAGVNIEEPENWGVLRTGDGYDLRGCTQLVVNVRVPTPGG